MQRILYSIESAGVEIQLPLNYYKKQAGTWQATELFEDHEMRVLRNCIFDLEIPPYIQDVSNMTRADQPWAEKHFWERVCGEPLNPGESYKIWPYNTFTEDNDPYMEGKKFSHTYMERFWPKVANEDLLNDKPFWNKGIRYDLGDLNDVIQQLKDNPLTRQAYLPVFFPEDTGAVHKQRVPCTLGYLFEIWDGVLDVTYFIRSCDIFRHFRNDVYFAMRLGQYVNDVLGTTVGKLTMFVSNLHLFENDLYAFKKRENKLLKS